MCEYCERPDDPESYDINIKHTDNTHCSSNMQCLSLKNLSICILKDKRDMHNQYHKFMFCPVCGKPLEPKKELYDKE